MSLSYGNKKAIGGNARPVWPFTVNSQSKQAINLIYWWPCNTNYDTGGANGRMIEMLRDHHALGGTSSNFADDKIANLGKVIYLRPTATSDYTFVWTLGACPLVTGQDFTFSYWAHRAATNLQGRWFGKSNVSCAVSWWNDSVTYYDTPRISGGTTTTGWHHFLFHSKGTANKSYIYIDGVQVATSGSTSFADVTTAGVFTFGRRNNAAGGGADNAAPGGSNNIGFGCDIRMYCPSLPDDVVPQLFLEQTRWELYAPIRKQVWFVPVASAAKFRKNFSQIGKTGSRQIVES